MREYLDGATAIARGALDAGCTFFAGYPISPATPILLHMVKELPKVGGQAIQAEDEIASISMCIGAVLAGAKAMTATSGPGISLYSENIGWAIMAEVPLVIVDCQRQGPGTGGATTGAQGDVQFVRWGTSGGYPIIALCPSSVAECYTLTMHAFNLAERFRCPVFVMPDKEMVMSMATVDVAEYERVPIRERRLAPADGQPFIPYRFDAPDEVPPMAHFGDEHLVRITGSSHDERGMLVKDPARLGRMLGHLAAKIEEHVDEITMVKHDPQPGARTLLIGYGTTARAMREAIQVARSHGRKSAGLTVQSLWPVPEAAIRAAAEGMERIVVAELNLGQYRLEIERLLHGPEIVGINRIDGELITPEQILEQIAD
jgi:2-oxoglutarate ferredoxin oxidoreductase subunit alpha